MLKLYFQAFFKCIFFCISLFPLLAFSKVCEMAECTKEAEENTPYCIDHTCQANYCLKAVIGKDASYCISHTCNMRHCQSKKVMPHDYCGKHEVDVKFDTDISLTLHISSSNPTRDIHSSPPAKRRIQELTVQNLELHSANQNNQEKLKYSNENKGFINKINSELMDFILSAPTLSSSTTTAEFKACLKALIHDDSSDQSIWTTKADQFDTQELSMEKQHLLIEEIMTENSRLVIAFAPKSYRRSPAAPETALLLLIKKDFSYFDLIILSTESYLTGIDTTFIKTELPKLVKKLGQIALSSPAFETTASLKYYISKPRQLEEHQSIRVTPMPITIPAQNTAPQVSGSAVRNLSLQL